MSSTTSRRLSAGPEARLPRRAAFVAVSLGLMTILACAGAVSPLLIVYQHQDGIPDAGLTGALAVYILPAAAALLCCGRLSDHLGRRPVALMALTSAALGCLVLTTVHGLPTLLTGRALQGLGAGLGTSALGAYAVDLQPQERPWLAAAVTTSAPTAGIAAGALVSGALVDYAPAPRTLVYLVFVALLVIAGLGVLASPETSTRQPGALQSLAPTFKVPAAATPVFLAACCCFVASWALGGFYQALGPSLAARVLGHSGHLFGGLVVACAIGTSTVGATMVARADPRRAMLAGCAALGVGTLIVLLALSTDSTATFLSGSILAGLGFGAAFTGGMRRLLAATTPSDRAGMLAAAYLVSYLGAAVPSFAAGLLTSQWGLTTVADAFGALVIALVSIAAVASVRSATANRLPSAMAHRAHNLDAETP